MPLKAVKVRTVLEGTTALMCHNVQLADPMNDWTRKIARLTSKRKMSDEDRVEKSRLEFLGGLYLHEGHVIVPVMNIKRCLKEAAKANRLGRHIDRALNPADPEAIANGVPLKFPHSSSTPMELWEIPGYRDTTMVASPGRVPRTRPQFSKWGVAADWFLYVNLLSVEDLRSIGEYAGLIEGLGDNRINGQGRFSFTLEEL